MIYAIRAIVRAVRRSPNAYAVIIGTAVILLVPLYLVGAVTVGANSRSAAPIAMIQRAIAQALDALSLPVLILSICPQSR
jgi:hypothetical protein